MPSSSTVAPDPSPAETPPRSKPAKAIQVSRPLKRMSPADGGRAKKRYKKPEAESDSDDQLSSPPSDLDEEAPRKKPQPKPTPKLMSKPKQKPKPKQKTKPKPKPAITDGAPRTESTNGSAAKIADNSESPLSDSQDVDSETMPGKFKDTQPEESDSDMSVITGAGGKPTGRKSKTVLAPEGGTTKSKASKSKVDAEVDPDDAEIKRLQGWLVKCGIRKMWWKELKPYGSSKAKIKHLKDMLADAGMTGRYSIEKATQIKEARELAADIEAVKEGAQRWGKDKDGSENDGEDKSKRRLVRGAKNYDFLSSDGEETD